MLVTVNAPVPQQALRPSRAMQNLLRDAGIPAIVTQRRGTEVYDLEFQGDLEHIDGPGTMSAREWAALIRQCFKCTITDIHADCRADWRPDNPVIMTGLTIEGDLTPKVTSAGKRRVHYAYPFMQESMQMTGFPYLDEGQFDDGGIDQSAAWMNEEEAIFGPDYEDDDDEDEGPTEAFPRDDEMIGLYDEDDDFDPYEDEDDDWDEDDYEDYL